MEYIPAKTLITKNKSTAWFGNDYNMNIYRGCCHGCIYCDSRSNCYQIENFAKVRAKENALEILRNDLRRKVRTGVIGTGSMSDPYNPFEKELHLTRNSLELINAYGFGVSVITKSDLITRDLDIYKDISEHSPVLCKVTITTFDDRLTKKIEPNVSSSKERFLALEKMSKAGLFSGVLLMPLLPFINDTKENVVQIVRKTADVGARFVYGGMGLTMRDGQREYLYEQLDKNFPGMKEKYNTRYGNRYQCSSPKAKTLYYAMANECEKLGLLYKMDDITKSYKMGYENTQLSFFK